MQRTVTTLKLAGGMAAMLCCTPTVAQSYASTVQSTGPTAYFRLTDPGTGSTTGGYTASWQGSVTTAPGTPLVSDPTNTGALFDGVNSTNPGIITTSLSGNVPGAGSIIAWVNLSMPASTAGHILYVAGESQSGNDLDLQFTTDDTLRFYTGGGENTAYTPDAATLVGQWHMITATYDGTLGGNSFRDIYWDGSLVSSDTGGVNGANKSSAFTIGYSPLFGSREFAGSIDEVAVFNRALTGSEVASVYASRLNVAGTLPMGAVPEPASWAMMIAGFGLIGFAMRYRRRTAILRYA